MVTPRTETAILSKLVQCLFPIAKTNALQGNVRTKDIWSGKGQRSLKRKLFVRRTVPPVDQRRFDRPLACDGCPAGIFGKGCKRQANIRFRAVGAGYGVTRTAKVSLQVLLRNVSVRRRGKRPLLRPLSSFGILRVGSLTYKFGGSRSSMYAATDLRSGSLLEPGLP